MHLRMHSSATVVTDCLLAFRLRAFQMLLLEHISTPAGIDHLRVKISSAVSADLLLEKFSSTVVDDRLREESS